jgi:hypothetical protein
MSTNVHENHIENYEIKIRLLVRLRLEQDSYILYHGIRTCGDDDTIQVCIIMCYSLELDSVSCLDFLITEQSSKKVYCLQSVLQSFDLFVERMERVQKWTLLNHDQQWQVCSVVYNWSIIPLSATIQFSTKNMYKYVTNWFVKYKYYDKRSICQINFRIILIHK